MGFGKILIEISERSIWEETTIFLGNVGKFKRARFLINFGSTFNLGILLDSNTKAEYRNKIFEVLPFALIDIFKVF